MVVRVRPRAGTSTTLKLGWEAPACNGSDVSEYALEMNSEPSTATGGGGGGGGGAFRRVYVGADTSFVVAKLKRVTSYTFRVIVRETA